jgi:hypothetical protein
MNLEWLCTQRELLSELIQLLPRGTGKQRALFFIPTNRKLPQIFQFILYLSPHDSISQIWLLSALLNSTFNTICTTQSMYQLDAPITLLFI